MKGSTKPTVIRTRPSLTKAKPSEALLTGGSLGVRVWGKGREWKTCGEEAGSLRLAGASPR